MPVLPPKKILEYSWGYCAIHYISSLGRRFSQNAPMKRQGTKIHYAYYTITESDSKHNEYSPRYCHFVLFRKSARRSRDNRGHASMPNADAPVVVAEFLRSSKNNYTSRGREKEKMCPQFSSFHLLYGCRSDSTIQQFESSKLRSSEVKY